MAGKTKVVLRRGTLAEWDSSNPILAKGEIGLLVNVNGAGSETNITKFKIGDGSNTWMGLPYFCGDCGDGGGNTGGGGGTTFTYSWLSKPNANIQFSNGANRLAFSQGSLSTPTGTQTIQSVLLDITVFPQSGYFRKDLYGYNIDAGGYEYVLGDDTAIGNTAPLAPIPAGWLFVTYIEVRGAHDNNNFYIRSDVPPNPEDTDVTFPAPATPTTSTGTRVAGWVAGPWKVGEVALAVNGAYTPKADIANSTSMPSGPNGSWTQITTWVTPDHDHDDLYYTEAEIDAKLANISVDWADIEGNPLPVPLPGDDGKMLVVDGDGYGYVTPGNYVREVNDGTVLSRDGYYFLGEYNNIGSFSISSLREYDPDRYAFAQYSHYVTGYSSETQLTAEAESSNHPTDKFDYGAYVDSYAKPGNLVPVFAGFTVQVYETGIGFISSETFGLRADGLWMGNIPVDVVPRATIADAGKSLTVDESGAYVLEDADYLTQAAADVRYELAQDNNTFRIDYFTPSAGAVGDVITVHGGGFHEAMGILLGTPPLFNDGGAGTPINIISQTVATFTVPPFAKTGLIYLDHGETGELVPSSTPFTFLNTSKAFSNLLYASTTQWDYSVKGMNGLLVLQGNSTLNFTSVPDGATGNLLVQQDATGNRVLTLGGSNKVINGGAGAVILEPGPSAITILSYLCVASTIYWTYGKNYT